MEEVDLNGYSKRSLQGTGRVICLLVVALTYMCMCICQGEVKASDRKTKFAIHYNRGLIFTIKDEIDNAVEEFLEAAKECPDNPDIYYQIGAAYASQDRWTEALKEFQKASELKVDYIESHYAAGRIYLKALGDSDKAIWYLKKAVELDPDHASAHHLIGVAYARQNRLTDASRMLLRAVQLDPDNVEARYELAQVHLKRKEYAESIAEFNRSLQLDPYYLKAHYGLAQAYLKGGDSKSGKEHLDLFESLTQQSEEINSLVRRLKGNSTDAQTWYELGLAHMRQKRWNPALEAMQKSITMDSSRYKPYEATGYIYVQLGKIIEAEKHFLKAIQINPNSADLYNNLGICSFSQGQFESAVDLFKRAIQLKPDPANFHLNLSNAYRQLGMNLKADEELAKYQSLKASLKSYEE